MSTQELTLDDIAAEREQANENYAYAIKNLSRTKQTEAAGELRRAERRLVVAVKNTTIGSEEAKTKYMNHGGAVVAALTFMASISDEAFETVMTEATEDGNLSRAEIVRRIKKVRQVKAIPVSRGRTNSHHVSLTRLIDSLNGLSISAGNISASSAVACTTVEEAKSWSYDLNEAIKALQQLRADIKEQL